MTVSVDAADIVAEFGTDADGDLTAASVTFGTATVDGVPTGSLSDVGFVYSPGVGTAGAFSIDTNASAFSGLADDEEAAVVIGFTVSDGTDSDMGEFSYQVDGENFGDFDFEVFFLGDTVADQPVTAMADDATAGVLIDVTLAVSGPADISDILGGGIELNEDLDGATGPALDDASLTIAIASAHAGSTATATAVNDGKAQAFANFNSEATAAADASRADAVGDTQGIATAVATGNSAASAMAMNVSDATASAENDSAAEATAENESSATAIAENASVATAASSVSSTSVAGSDEGASATATAESESVGSAEASNVSVATVVSSFGSAASGTATNNSEAVAVADNGSAADAIAAIESRAVATASGISIAASSATDASLAIAIADANSSSTANATDGSSSNASAVDVSISLAVATNGLISSAAASSDHSSTAISDTGEPTFSLSAALRGGSPAVTSDLAGSIISTPGSSIPLPIESEQSDGETIDEVIISGLPVGSVLSDGTSNVDGTTWTFAGPPPMNLMLTPPVDFLGEFNVHVLTRNGDATAVASTPITVMVTCASVSPGDGVVQLGETLVIAGTSGKDLLKVQEKKGEFRIKVNKQNSVRDMEGVDQVLMCGFDGPDKLIRPAKSTVPGVLNGGDDNDKLTGSNADETLLGGSGSDKISSKGGNDFVDAGDGKDKINAGSGDDIVLAGDGDDVVSGSKGRDILIGDAGRDQLKGSSGDDILIGGSTDLDWEALQSILAEWTSERSYEERVANISGDSPSPSGANGDDFLTLANITDSTDGEKLEGGSDTDWFFANSTDLLSGRKDFEEWSII